MACRYNDGEKLKKRVQFSSNLILETKEAPIYERTAVQVDLFSCDVCSIQIPAGMKGFEPYGTCEVCVDGFDACGACCGTEALMHICQTTVFSPSKQVKPTIRSKCHDHLLTVVDRKAEVAWANNNNRSNISYGKDLSNTATGALSPPTEKRDTKRSLQSRTESQKKKPKRSSCIIGSNLQNEI